MSNGFLISSPGSRHGDNVTLFAANRARAQKFTCPGSALVNILEIGLWANTEGAGGTAYFDLAIFDHDSTNDCPSTPISNSDSGELSVAGTTVQKVSKSYSTKPQCAGGTLYWLGIINKLASPNRLRADDFATGGTTLRCDGGTYPTWPTDTQWHSHTDETLDIGIYVVYEAAAAHYTLNAQGGSYVLAGQDAGLKAARKIAAAPSSYALTGQAVALKLARKIAAGPGSYSLTGQDAILRAIRKIAAEGGSYLYAGQDANLVIGQHYILVAEPGSYGEPYSKIFVTLDGRIYKKMGNTYLRLS